MSPNVLALPVELLLHVLHCFGSKELRALAITSRAFRELLRSREEVWRNVFRYQWNHVNFYIAPTDTLRLSPFLQTQYPCASDGFRFLCQAVQPVPFRFDMEYERAYVEDDPADYALHILPHTLPRIRLAAGDLADSSYGRSVRANAPYRFVPTVTVHKEERDGGYAWRVDLSSSMYFEMTIGVPQPAPYVCDIERATRHATDDNWDIISIGLAPPRYVMIENHPGWESFSYGYHGEEGVFMTEPEARQ
ncbi:Aste57867_22537 [Aphanomyces stellatus]|uniref:Aste57867_22537 protein n=1 Tax=Aphanomyces stellatus TaxID=120398 RepID=A0A485LKL7_9STRA|nr:hypothetical protein As57867_022467 [Aphanomyces stellatus]VFT99197.1 Aste57867_22537 [Aphanomyces stellatus]